MKGILLAIMILMLVGITACTSGLTSGDRTSDDAHAFLLQSTQIIDKIEEDIAPEEEAFLVIKYQIENLQSQPDSTRQWTDQMILATNDESYDPILLTSLDDQLWETSLLPGEPRAGYLAFIVPEDISDFTLTLTFPTSETEAIYDFRPIDKRVSINVDYVLTRLEQIERTKRIWLIGGLLASFSNSPIRYLGTILVPEEEIDDLMEQTDGLGEDAKKQAIEDYLIEQGHCRLE